MPRRDRYAWFLKPRDQDVGGELASLLSKLPDVSGETLSIDITAEKGLELQTMDSSQVLMTRLVVAPSAFSDFELKRNSDGMTDRSVHLTIDAKDLSRAMGNGATKFVIYQLSNDEDHVVVEKYDSGVKWVLSLRSFDGESMEVPPTNQDSTISFQSGAEMLAAIKELRQSLKLTHEYVDFRLASRPEPVWIVSCKSDSLRFSQRIPSLDVVVTVDRKISISGTLFVAVTNVASRLKGRASMRVVNVNGAFLFDVRGRSVHGDFRVDFFVAPKIDDQ